MLRAGSRVVQSQLRFHGVRRQMLAAPSWIAIKQQYSSTATRDSSTPPLKGGRRLVADHLEGIPKDWFDPKQLKSRLEEMLLLCAPKGFGKYYRKPNSSEKGAGESVEGAASGEKKSTSGSSSSSSSSDSKANSNSRKTGGTGGSGGGGGNKKNDEGTMMRLLLAAGIGVAAFAMVEDMKPGKEISWQDFVNQLLETGQVDRIIVSNKNIARVVLRQNLDKPNIDSDNYSSSSSSDSSSYSFGGPSDTKREADRYTSYGDRESAAGSGRGGAAAGGGGGGGDEAGRGKFSRYPTIGHPAADAKTNAQYYFNIGTVESFERKLEEAQKSLGITPRDFIPVVYVSETSWTQELVRFLPTLLLIGAMMYMMRGAANSVGGGGGPGGIFKIGKSTAKRANKESVQTTFADVAGCDEAKREIMEFVQFLKDPKKFTDLGAKIPKGALLCGPPGTGKTLLAKATAGEASVPFFSISGSDFVEMFVGVGPSRVRDLFKEARESAPCILFIDEIDAVGRQRGRGGFSGGNDERENTLNQLLVEMDGFDASTNVVVLAGTNRVDILDQALTRPGRFDRQITVDKPDIQGRKAIFEVYLKKLTLDGEVDQYSGRLAALTPGFVGADIANICNEAAIQAARRDKKTVDFECFEAATDRVIGGLESRKIMTPHEKRVVAYHEAGHAVAGWNLEHADPLLKVTIVPRSSGALGYAQYLPKELFLRTKEQIMDTVCMALAGRASEQVNFGNVTTGAADDLRRVTQIVYQMVQVYGMNQRVGQVAFPREDGGGFPQDKMYSNATAEVMDEEVRDIVDKAYKRTIALMEERKEQVRLVAELLLEKETITNIDVAEVIGKRPYSAGKEYDEYISMGWNSGKKAAASAADENVGEENDAAATGGATLSPA